jgi:hypothetical protein
VFGKLGELLNKDVGALVKDAGKVLNTDVGTLAKGAGKVLNSDLGDLLRSEARAKRRSGGSRPPADPRRLQQSSRLLRQAPTAPRRRFHAGRRSHAGRCRDGRAGRRFRSRRHP